ncbi:MAG TPA: cytochrome c oxidase assembly protein [Xanthobacteraceae bacterium]|nr:cytochrome c oxidase assembly protein [Xanthobacteraceae bacterium]
MSAKDDSKLSKRDRDLVVAAACGAVVGVMVALSFAAVPLYDWFCRTTGWGGTTQVSTVAPVDQLGRKITVRFDANVGPGLPWKFEPEVTSMEVHIGQVITTNYRVVNLVARETVGIAAYNVAPLTVGAYFHKINCFCFSEQRLKPGEKMDMTVVFYVDPALAKDAEQNDLNNITLSYTFFPVREPQRVGTAGAATTAAGRI